MIDSVVLDNICLEVAQVFNGIMNRDIDCMHNREARILGPTFVANEIGKAVNSVGMQAMLRQEVSVDEVKELIENLISIVETFEVKELRAPISKLIDLVKIETGEA